MSASRKTVRVFISSTFRDMHAERDHLVTVVFPELRERVEQLGLEFFDVDLRWGVPEKGVDGEKANSWEYCRKWIEEVEPFFVCILGQRYGHRPEPRELRDPAEQSRQEAQRRSITELEVRHAVLNDRRKRRSYFYLRDTLVPVPPPAATAEERAAYDEFVDPPEQLAQLDALKADIRGCGRPVRGYECRWNGKEFTDLDKMEKEKQFGPMVLDDLWSGVLRDERYVSKEVWRQALGADPDSDTRYTHESEPVPRELWEKIVALAKPPPKELLDAEREQMEAFAAARLRWFQGRTNELKQLTDFINSTDEKSPRLAAVVAVPGQGKSALLARLWENVWSSAFRRPGPAEAGTPNFIPAETASEERRARSDAPYLIPHFVGATERSANAHALVERLLGELDRSGITWPAGPQNPGQEPKRDFNSLCLRLAQRLGDYAGERRIVILLDALNQLSDGHDLQWLPHRLGPSVRVIISCVEDASPLGVPASAGPGASSESHLQAVPDRVNAELQTNAPRSSRREEAHPSVDQPSTLNSQPTSQSLLTSAATAKENEQRVLRALASRQPASLRVPLGPLTEADVRTIVVAYLAEYCHELDREHLDTLCAIMPARNPLYLLVMLNELRTLGGNDLNRIVPARIASMPQDHPDTVSLFRWVLQRLEVFGPEAVRWWCLYLAHGRVGMASHELADLLSLKLGTDAAATALRIERGLRRYLQRRGPQLDFFHSQLRQAVFEQYSLQAEAATVHLDIATYFHDLADPERNQSWKGDSPRPFRELPFHFVQARIWPEVVATLEDIAFLEAKVTHGLAFDLVGDFTDAVRQLPRDHPQHRILCLLEEAVCRDIYFISRHKGNYPQALFQCLWNYGWWYDCPEAAKHYDPTEGGWKQSPTWERPGLKLCALLEKWRVEREGRTPGFYWLRSGRPPQVALGSALKAVLRGHDRGVNSVAYSPDGARIVSGSGDSGSYRGKDDTVRIWDARSGKSLAVLREHKCGVSCVAFSPDSTRIVSGSWDYTMRLWDTRSRKSLAVLHGHEYVVTSVAFSPDGARLVSGSKDKTVRLRDARSGEAHAVLRGHEQPVRSVAFSPDGARIVSGSEDKTVRVWDARSGAELAVLCGHEREVWSVAFSPDGARIASASGGMSRSGSTVRLWDARSGSALAVLRGHESGVNSVAFSPDGARIVSGSYDKTVRLWDARSGAVLAVLRGHEEPVRSVAFSPDGARIVSGSGGVFGKPDHTVRLWDSRSGVALAVLRGHESIVTSVAFSPDGARIVSRSYDNCVRLWDAQSGECVQVIQGTGDVSAIAADPVRYPYRALRRGDETMVKRSEAPGLLARFPVGLGHIVPCPTGRTWAGSTFNHIYLLTLEGEL